jgi:hypothetical protein
MMGTDNADSVLCLQGVRLVRLALFLSISTSWNAYAS